MTALRRLLGLPSLGLALAGVLGVATAGLVALGYRATWEWQRSTSLLVERRVDLMLALLATALNRDMKGAQVSVLLPIEREDLQAEPPYDLRDAFARAFARFPYPESFFIWRAGPQADGVTYFFNRADRAPAWDAAERRDGPYPVVMRRDPAAARGLIGAVRGRAHPRSRFSVLEYAVGDSRYQVVAQLFRSGSAAGELSGLVGFTVNLAWVRDRYFRDLTREIARLGGEQEPIALLILDHEGHPVTATAAVDPGAPAHERRFPLLFFDPAMRTALAGTAPPIEEWTARVGGTAASPLAAARRSARRGFVLLALAAAVTTVGLLLTARAVRAGAELAAMKSDFVSTVTHELKTPLALIRLVGDTLALGRYTSTKAIEDYASLLSQEARRLTRLIDNLLTYARVSDVERSYSFETLELADLVDDALEHFRPRLAALGFEVQVDVPLNLSKVRADRTSLLQVLDNIIDNAIKYSGDGRLLGIQARAEDHRVRLEVCDRGRGIAELELSRVFERFYRGRDVREDGSGLGLAIVRRIVNDHGGQVEIRSKLGEGTAVSLVLPAA